MELSSEGVNVEFGIIIDTAPELAVERRDG